MPKRQGRYTVLLAEKPSITGWAAVVGEKEGEGPLKSEFDKIFKDEFLGEKTFEKAESRLQKEAFSLALKKSGNSADDIDCVFAGDLLNQCIGSSFSLRDFAMPFAGLYGACSTMALSLCIAGIMTASGALRKALCVTSSHFCAAERQYRLPLEYGGQRSPAAQWTVTGSGSCVVESEKKAGAPCISAVHFGRIFDLGVTDANNMGAAMAPAAAETVAAFLKDTATSADDYDLILTGDLGKTGSELMHIYLKKEHGLDITEKHNDCGLLMFDLEGQDVHAGGSGCGCSASVVCSKILNDIASGSLKKVLFIATGALLSPTSTLQGESIPAIAHAVVLEPGN